MESQRPSLAGHPYALKGASQGGPEPGPMLRVLGEFSFDFPQLPGPDTKPWRRTHARRLVQFVASAPGLCEPRARVLAALWPDFDEQRARNRLHHTVHWIRQAFEQIVPACRPQIAVVNDRVEIQLAAGTHVDAQRMMDGLAQDMPDDAARFAAIERALPCYAGEFAPDWHGVEPVDERRRWFAQLHDGALREAAELAAGLGHAEAALQYAQRRTQLPGADLEVHRRFVRQLADCGRSDAALLHCRALRATFEEEAPAELPEIDALTREIQQRANRAATAAVAGAPAAPVPAAPVAEPLRARLPPRKSLLGYQGFVEAGIQCLEDPYATLVSLVGPPGCGKTAVACELAHRALAGLRHGAIWVDCGAVDGRRDALAAALAAALCEATPECERVGDPAAVIAGALHGREMLVVLDGLTASRGLEPLVAGWIELNRDVRWLVTGWAGLHVPGEKAIFVDATSLLEAGPDHGVSPAAQLLARACRHGHSLQDKRIRSALESLVREVDGLPMLIEVVAEELHDVWPNELMSRLDRDPLALLRPTSADSRPAAHQANARLQVWLRQAPAGARRLLAMAGRCRSWLTREDLQVLLDDDPSVDVNQMLDHCVRHQLMVRRVRHTHQNAWSEFRVQKFVSAMLKLGSEAVPPAQASARIAHWLSHPPLGDLIASGIAAAQELSWFEDRFEDLDQLVNEWLVLGRHAEIAQLCTLHSGRWRESQHAQHAQRVLGWLEGLGEHMGEVGGAAAPRLLLERGRLRALLGQFQGAFTDAGQAIARMGPHQDAALRLEAMRLIDRFGAASPQAQRPGSLDENGVGAGERLLRMARQTLQRGDFAKALQLSGEAIGVFNYFGLTRSLVTANQMRARIAFSMGDTALALQCIANAERAASAVDDAAELGRSELIRARILLSEMQFTRAIESISGVMARPEHANNAALQSRGMLLLAWAHFASGTLVVARALANELLERVRPSVDASVRLGVELLTGLLDVRQGARASALLHIGGMLDIMSRDMALVDPQGALISAADLGSHLGWHDLALTALAHLDEFACRPDQRLRPWVDNRARAIRDAVPASSAMPPAAERPDDAGPASGRDVLVALIGSCAAPPEGRAALQPGSPAA